MVVRRTDSASYYVESPALVDDDQQFDHETAALTLKRLNGIARAIGPGFHPVRLTGGYTGPDGVNGLPPEQVVSRDRVSVIRTDADGALIPGLPSKGPRYARLAQTNQNVADAMRVMNGQFEPELDWFDVCKVREIVEDDLHKADSSIVDKGWATKADLERLNASANNPVLSGDKARHARMQGTPGPQRKMTLAEANALVVRVVVAWIESRPGFATE